MLIACERDEPQIVTKRGVATAALVPIEEWSRLSAGAIPGLKDLLLSDKARTDDLIIPPRKTVTERKPPKF